MSQFRLAALLTLLAAAGCYRYSDASQQSTMADPQYMSGPPGGAMDPDYGYGEPAGDPRGGSVAAVGPGAPGGPAVAGDVDDEDNQDADEDSEAPAPPDVADASPDPSADPSVAVGPGMPGPEEAGAPGPDAPQADDGIASAPEVAAAPTGTVGNAEIDATLDGYGQWVETDDYGAVWRPDATVVGVDFTPYESGGSWVQSDAGWAFSCDYPWGWLPFHYGRWAWFHDYWGWVPGHRWGPAWVDWRHGNGVVGWRPRPPRLPDHRPATGHHGRGVLVRDHRHSEQHDAHWRFATTRDFSRPHVRSHLYGNLAEGLRVTSKVAAPPLRARTTVHASDLMRNRFAAGRSFQPGRPGQPGRSFQPGPGRVGGPVQVRDHRGPESGRPFQPPAQGIRPSPGNQQPYGAYRRPPIYRPPISGQPPAQTVRPPRYQQPYGAYRPPAGAQPGQPPAQTVRPPRYQQPGQPPVRTYQPPVRTYQPHMPSAPPPSRSWNPPSSPPVHSGSPSGGPHSGGGGSSSHSGGGGNSGGGNSSGPHSSGSSSHSGSSSNSSHSSSSSSTSGHRR